MKKSLVLAALVAALGCSSPPPAPPPAQTAHVVEIPEARTSAEALTQVCEGNKRFAEGHSAHPHADVARAAALAKEQHPPTVVLACADSRVSPEIILDEGLGDLFVVRVAGNVLEPSIVGSIEYAVEHLGSKLVLVLGHSSCGAVKAALGVHGKPEATRGLGPNLAALVARIDPVIASLPTGTEDERTAAAVRANAVLVSKELLEQSAILKEAAHEGKLAIAVGVYDLATERVELVPHEMGHEVKH